LHVLQACLFFAFFSDLVKAFDWVIRELAMGWPQDCAEDHVEPAMELGMPRNVVDFICHLR
jgi:hypothetical protein